MKIKDVSEESKRWLEEYRKNNPCNKRKIQMGKKWYSTLKYEKIKNYLKNN
jgi:hypothetical protein